MLVTDLSRNNVTIHGTLVRVGGEGILLVGKAGIGKSTTALKYLADGHQLVADDVVAIERIGDKLFGVAPAVLKGMLSIPDLGIFDVREALGPQYFTDSSVISRCVEIVWHYDDSQCRFDVELHGVRLQKSYRKIDIGRERLKFPGEICSATVKQSESHFFRSHLKIVASANFR